MSEYAWWWGFPQNQRPKPIKWEEAARWAWCFLNCVRIADGQPVVPLPDSWTISPAQSALPVEIALTPTGAAKLLGVAVDAAPDVIRAALRAKMSNGAHPDHGGDEARAKQLIAAKNLLIEHARSKS